MNDDMDKELEELKHNLLEVDHKIVVLSGKGGVGKSFIASNLAAYSASLKKLTGLLDIDIHGPSIPKLLGLEGRRGEGYNNVLLPVEYNDFLKVISIGFFLPTIEEAVIWRGPRKYGLIKQFLKDVKWGKIDYLIVDSPPGTGDEPLAVVQLLEKADGAVIVTTPQDVALSDVRKSIIFCRRLELPVIGIIENMSGFVCPECKTRIDIFKTGGGELLAREMGVPFLGKIPIHPEIVEKGDKGLLFFNNSDDSVVKEEMINCFKKIVG